MPGLPHAVAVIAVIAKLFSAWSIGFLPTQLDDGFNELALVQRMEPPRLDAPGRIAGLASVPLASIAARNTTPHPAVEAVAPWSAEPTFILGVPHC